MHPISPELKKISDHYQKHKTSLIGDFLSFLRFQSVSSESSYKKALLECMDWLKNEAIKLEMTVDVWKRKTGHPILFCKDLSAGKEAPTLLIYNHYDVQPVDPVEEWNHAPFDPCIIDGQVYARGAQDNKGQCFYVLQALKILRRIHKTFPVNLKWIIEGEEEVGSPSLHSLLAEKKEQLHADYLVIADVSIPAIDKPAITLGVRGIVTMDLTLTGSTVDLHSGAHGGIVYNPLHALVELLAKLRSSDGSITVPGFYDDVAPIIPEEKEALCFQFNKAAYQKNFGAQAIGGEHDQYTPLERAAIRPTIEINGIHGGYGGDGFKTVIPAKAHAKISCRLVPGQDPEAIGNIVSKFLSDHCPKGINLEVKLHPGCGAAIRVNAESKLAKAYAKAYEEAFQLPCNKVLSGGSLPIAAELADASGAEVLMMGLGLDDDNIHAPNEHFGLDRLEKGCLITARAIELLAGSEE